MANWKVIGHHTGEMTVTMDGSEWQSALDAARERLEMRSRQVGTDPALVEKSDIYGVAVNLSMESLFNRGIEELDLSPISEPVVDVVKMNAEGVTVSFKFSVVPEFEIPDLSGLKYTVDEVYVSDEDVEAEIKEMSKNGACKTDPDAGGEKSDEFASSLGIDDVSTMEELKGSVRKALEMSREAKAVVDAENRLLDDLCALVPLAAPDGMVDMELDSLIISDKDALASRNVQFEEYLKSMKMGEGDYREKLRPEAAKNIKTRLILEKIAHDENLIPGDEDVKEEYEAMARAYGMEPEDFKTALPESDVRYQKSLAMALEYLKKIGQKEKNAAPEHRKDA